MNTVDSSMRRAAILLLLLTTWSSLKSVLPASVTAGWRKLRRRHVSVLFQLNATECGAACLAMLLSFHGRPTRVAEVRELTGVGRDGLNASTIIAAASKYGLRMKAFALQPADFDKVPMPAIVHWSFDHFVVVEYWTPNKVTIVDPASGRRTVTALEFSNHFTGVVLAAEPAAGFDCQAKRA